MDEVLQIEKDVVLRTYTELMPNVVDLVTDVQTVD